MNFCLSGQRVTAKRERRGAMLPLVALLLPIVVIMLGFAVDLAFMQTTRAELRLATDVAARAGAIALAETESSSLAKTAAVQMARRNDVAGKPLLLRRRDIVIGRSERDASGKWVFDESGSPVNSVQVLGDRRTSSRSGSVGLFFGRLYGDGQFQPTVSSISTFMNVDICLVLDRSGSMQGQKLLDLQSAVATFVSELNATSADEQLALASYSSTATLDSTLSTNYAPVLSDVQGFTASGMTAIGLALEAGIDGVMGTNRRSLSEPIIVLMTDGNHNTDVEPIVPARDAAARGITVHTITFGNDADITRMQDVAEETGGKHYHATTGSELTAVFRAIAKSLPTQLTQ